MKRRSAMAKDLRREPYAGRLHLRNIPCLLFLSYQYGLLVRRCCRDSRGDSFCKYPKKWGKNKVKRGIFSFSS